MHDNWRRPINGPVVPFVPVSVGYEYESCADYIVWERRMAQLQGFEMIASNLGGWSLDKHHILNLQSGEGSACSSVSHFHSAVLYPQPT